MIKFLKKFFTPIFLILVVVFFVFYLKDIDLNVLKDIKIDWSLLVLASLISLSFRYWGVYIWRMILKTLGAKELPPFTILTQVYAKSWMGRYIPGTVTWIAGKIYLANKLGISKSRLTISSLLEAGTQVVATLCVALLLLSVDPRLSVLPWQYKPIMIGAALLLIVFLYPPILNYVVRKGYKLIRRKEAYDELNANGQAVVKSFLMYTVGAFVTGSSYYFLCASLSSQITFDMYFYIVGALSLAGALGMLTPFVPSGLGVRDGVQLVLLSIIMPKEIALAITVFSRLWSALIDVLFYALAQGWYHIYKKKGE